MKRENFIKNKKYLFWYVRNPENVSDEILVETILNFGDWEDVKYLIKFLGIKKTAEIFRNNSGKARSNYRPEIKNYFTLYFHEYA